MKKLYIALISLIGFMGGMGVQAQTSAEAIAGKKQPLFSSVGHESTPYRIPAIATLNNGQVLVIADHRPCGADVGNGEVDIYAKVGTIGTDGSYTWDPATNDGLKIADGTDETNGTVINGYGDAAVVVDRESGNVLVMCVAGNVTYGDATNSKHNRMARITYNSVTEEWSSPEDVTDKLFGTTTSALSSSSYNVASMFFASGRLLQSRIVKTGDYHRIYGALLVREYTKKSFIVTYYEYSEANYVVYSDDFGASWKLLGGKCCDGGNEAKLEELPNGDIVMSSRTSGGRYFNVFNFSDLNNASGSWGSATKYSFGGSNSTNGELLMYPGLVDGEDRVDSDGNKYKYNVMFQSLPTEDSRSKVSVFYKAFDASTPSFDVDDFTSGWTKGIEVDNGASAYSTMTILPNGEVGFLYEDEYSTSQGASGGTANIVYVPLTVEELTNNAYKLPANLTIGTTGYATFFAPYAVNIPEGITAKFVNTEENAGSTGVLKYTELQGVIPANTAVVLKGEPRERDYEFTTAYGTANVTANNALFGYAVKTPVADKTGIYALANKSAGVAFYRFAGSNYAAGKAYLNVNKLDTGSEVRSFALFDDDDATAIKTLPGQDVDAESATYDLSGRRVQKVQKGLYIVNGKKVIR